VIEARFISSGLLFNHKFHKNEKDFGNFCTGASYWFSIRFLRLFEGLMPRNFRLCWLWFWRRKAVVLVFITNDFFEGYQKVTFFVWFNLAK
jgi:hypothetical protein